MMNENIKLSTEEILSKYDEESSILKDLEHELATLYSQTFVDDKFNHIDNLAESLTDLSTRCTENKNRLKALYDKNNNSTIMICILSVIHRYNSLINRICSFGIITKHMASIY